MNTEEITQSISKQDFDLDSFVRLVISDEQARSEIVHQMLHHEHIMVYYHCYYVIAKASEQCPELFYPYWDDIECLLDHKNSYHRDFAITILANLTAVDKEDRFSLIFDNYFEHLHDAKFMTAHGCIRNAQIIIRNKPELKDGIISLLLDIDHQCCYPEKQKGLMKGAVLEIIEQVYEKEEDKKRLKVFILRELTSVSPKTRKKAKELALKFSLR
ncbi:MAG: hypothetical protein EHM41_14230 [Chloroflexi bacterium]|nr:MAG: hypothetical protein EHM41_14230 [Chloroflexota bacterium]